MIAADETFDGTWPFAPHFTDAAGFRMHYADEGEGSPIICLHGEPTWGYLYRNFIPPLAKTHRVVVPDHMGFGKSETPQDREYTLKSHTENLAALIDDLGLRDITFVAQDWGGLIATQYTLRNAARVKRICFMNTVTGYGPRSGEIRESTWFRWVGANLDNGRLRAVLTDLPMTITSVMRYLGFENTAAINRTWERAYGSPFETAEESLGALEFPLDAYLGRVTSYVTEGAAGIAALKQKPAMLAEGMKDRAIPPDVAIADFKAMWPEGPIVELPNAGHFCQEDAPETLVALIQQFIQMTP
jgi:haloalkane dehalogenase